MAVSYGLYFAAFGALCLAVSAWASSSRLALVVLLGFWMLNVLIAPRTASDIARFFRPAPSAFAFGHQMEAALAQGIDGHNPADERISKLRDELLKKYNVDSIERLPVNFAGVRLQEGENYGNKVYDAAYGRLWQTFGEQDGMRERLSLLAPGLAIRNLSMAFAGTDFPQHAHFAKHAEEYRRSIQLLMNNDLITHASNTGAYYADHSLWNKLPEFAYTAPGLPWVLERQWPSVAVLAVWFAWTAAAAVVAARRLNVA
jgi:ABC-2 type transport system permease protein